MSARGIGSLALEVLQRESECFYTPRLRSSAQQIDAAIEDLRALLDIRDAAAAEDLHLNEREEQRIEDWQNREREIGESLRRSRGFVTFRTVRDLALASLLVASLWACLFVLGAMQEVAR